MYTYVLKSDPRFRSTLDAVLKSPERGGLTANVGGEMSHTAKH